MPIELVKATSASSLGSVLGGLVIGLAVLAFVIWNQLRAKPARSSLTLPTVVGVLGVVNLVDWAGKHPLTTGEVLILIGSFVVFAIGLGAVRAWTVRLFDRNGAIWRQGTWVTALLWLVAVGLHLLVDARDAVGTVSLLLYLALSLAAQRSVIMWRVRKLEHGRPTPG